MVTVSTLLKIYTLFSNKQKKYSDPTKTINEKKSFKCICSVNQKS